MKLVFDINGGDNREDIIMGALDASKEFDAEIILVGDMDFAKDVLSNTVYDEDKVEIIDAKETIENNEDPAFAIRRKKDSSLVVALKLIKENKDYALISAGSTGALLAGGLFIVGRIKGIKRGVLPVYVPGIESSTVLIDSGANTDTTPELLLQFANLGKVFLETQFKINNPKIGLLNIGAEEGKGNNLTKKTYELLKDSSLNFAGNVESRDILTTDCDLVVCDGFAGNILLKGIEGTVNLLAKIMFKEIQKSNIGEDDKLELIKGVKSNISGLNSDEVGGTILLGIDGNIIKAHGSSNRLAIKNAAKYAIEINNNEVVKKIKEKMGDEDKWKKIF